MACAAEIKPCSKMLLSERLFEICREATEPTKTPEAENRPLSHPVSPEKEVVETFAKV